MNDIERAIDSAMHRINMLLKADDITYKIYATLRDALQEKAERDKMRCENCIFWKDRQIQQPDGTYRDYAADDEMIVTIEKGINIGEHCTKHGDDDKTGSWFWAQANDFCSRFEPKESEGKTDEQINKNIYRR